jgi:hypothetical protein
MGRWLTYFALAVKFRALSYSGNDIVKRTGARTGQSWSPIEDGILNCAFGGLCGFPRVDVEPAIRCRFSSGANIFRHTVRRLTFDRGKAL